MSSPESASDPLGSPGQNSTASNRDSTASDSQDGFGDGTDPGQHDNSNQLIQPPSPVEPRDTDWQQYFDNYHRRTPPVVTTPPEREIDDPELRAAMERWDRMMARGPHDPDDEFVPNNGGCPSSGPPVLSNFETARDDSSATIERIVSAFRREEACLYNTRYTVRFYDKDHIPFGFMVRFLRREVVQTQYDYAYATPANLSHDLLAVLRHQLQSYSIQLLEQETANPLSVISEVPEQESDRGFGCAHCTFLSLQGICPLRDQPGSRRRWQAEACQQCIGDGHFCIVPGTMTAPYSISAGPDGAEDLPTILPLPMGRGDESSQGPGIANRLDYWIDQERYNAYMRALGIQ